MVWTGPRLTCLGKLRRTATSPRGSGKLRPAQPLARSLALPRPLISAGFASRFRVPLILDPTPQSQFLKEQPLAFAPRHFSLLRKAINLVAVSLEPFDRCSIEHVEARRR